MTSIDTDTTDSYCGLFRRMLAISYDLILIIAVLFVATAILLPFTHGNAIHSGNSAYLAYLTAWIYLYFIWHWTHGGQTLGMRAWKIRLLDDNAGPVSWSTANKRFLLAFLSWLFVGSGFLWAALDREGLAFHDRYSRSRLYREPG